MHRFFVTPEHIEDERVTLAPEQAHQLYRVLRLRPGATICVLDGEGLEYIAELVELSTSTATARVQEKRPCRTEPRVRLCLGLGLIKGEKMDWAVQKATEVGAAEIVPLACAHSVVRVDAERAAGKVQRWQRIAMEAAEQCRRGRIPVVTLPQTPAQLLARVSEFDRMLLADEQETAPLAATLQPEMRRVLLLIGPEGGFAPEEAGAARTAGAISISLGPRILRAETAAVVGCALVVHELERGQTTGETGNV